MKFDDSAGVKLSKISACTCATNVEFNYTSYNFTFPFLVQHQLHPYPTVVLILLCCYAIYYECKIKTLKKIFRKRFETSNVVCLFVSMSVGRPKLWTRIRYSKMTEEEDCRRWDLPRKCIYSIFDRMFIILHKCNATIIKQTRLRF